MLANGISSLFKVVQRLRRSVRIGWSAVRNELYVIIAWALITWGIFQFNPRAWAISVGLYLGLEAVLGIFIGEKKDVR